MQLNLETDYALRCVMFLAEKNRLASSKEMMEELGFNTIVHVQKILRKLRDAGIVKVKIGANGGYILAKEPDKISVGEVLNCMEETMRINRCLEPDHFCSRNAVETCPMHKFYVSVQKLLDDSFNKNTIKDIMDLNYKK